MALSNYRYDPTQYKQGVYGDGRIAYRKNSCQQDQHLDRSGIRCPKINII